MTDIGQFRENNEDAYYGDDELFIVSDGMGGTRSVTTTDFVMETGLKFRVNMKYSPLKFLAKVTDFWGFRLGLKYQGNVWDIKNLGLVMEIGAGTF